MDSETPLKREIAHHPRTFADHTYVYPVVSRRSGGVSLGVNLNLDKLCNFACPYCQVDRTVAGPPQKIDLQAIEAELEDLLATVDSEGVCRVEKFAALPDANKRLRDVAISGDGEPTMVPEFEAVCGLLRKVQAKHAELDFKLILITNATLLDRPKVRKGIDMLLEANGEVWAKLDAGSEAWYQKVNLSRVPLDKVEANLVDLGLRHPFTVQSFFCTLEGVEPSETEIALYLDRLRRVKAATGDHLRMVQLYTLARTPAQSFCGPLSHAFLQGICGQVRALESAAEVYGSGD